MSGYAAIIFDDDECTPSSVWYGTKEDALSWADEACAKGKNAFVARITDERWRVQCLTDTLPGARARH